MNSENYFDYIIIGAGSAGSVLANRLSENPSSRVLVLEDGGHDLRPSILMPIGYGLSINNPNVNWMYQTDYDEGLNNRIDFWPRGKILGGSSSINAMVYIRGQAQDYDHWRDLGNIGWGYDDVLPFFKKSETSEALLSGRADQKYRGDNGPVFVSDLSKDLHPLCQTYIQAATELGLQHNPDFNGAQQEGVGLYQNTMRKGTRMSAARAYLWRISHPWSKRKRQNLEIQTSSFTNRILFEGKRAIGVEYIHKGIKKYAYTHREIISCCGAVNSPKLLQLSGIGDIQHLKSLGIAPVQQLKAVGQNLQDHLGVSYLYEANQPTLNNRLHPWWGKLWAGMQYAFLRRGPLALGVNQAGGFFRTDDHLNRPNMQLYFTPVSYSEAQKKAKAKKINSNQINHGHRYLNPDPFPGFLLCAQALRPKSRGYIQIKSSTPQEHPIIQPQSFSHPDDMAEMLQGVKFLRKLASTKTLSSIIKREITPGEQVQNDQQLIDHIRQDAGTVYHPSGTCAMGIDPNQSVVDPQLRVHGIQGLRVADASIFPVIPSGNTNAPAIMVGEKAADMILNQANNIFKNYI